jgi:hypothetical protein
MKKENTIVSFSYKIAPLKNVHYEITGILGNINESLISNLYENNIGKKVNIVLSELMNNAIGNVHDKESEVTLHINIQPESLEIQVINAVSEQRYLDIKSHLEKIKIEKDHKQMMAQTIRRKQADRQQGGLGLIRLAAENKALLSVSYNKKSSYMTIKSKINI